MSASMIHASSPDHWLGWLAASIGGYLNDQETIDDLDQDYREFLRSPVATDELRRILPPPRKRKKVRAAGKRVGEMTVFLDIPSHFHPYECDGPGRCVHCDRRYEKSIASETGTALRDHDPSNCPLCDPDYDGIPNPHWKEKQT